MPSQIYALALIILSLFPGFSGKADLENKITEEILGKPQSAQEKIKTETRPPHKLPDTVSISANAKAAYFIDYNSSEVLLAKNEDQKLPVASTTKLMTAIIVIEKLDPNKVITVSNLTTQPLDAVMGLSNGDQITVQELLKGLLINSGADAALALAVATSGTEEKFVALMNEKAANFGLTNTEFSNPVGRDDFNNTSTVEDIAKLTRLALTNPIIFDTVATKNYVARSQNGKAYFLQNTNQLLADPNYRGVKTGTTYEAGQCLVALYDDGERKLLGVVLNSPNRYNETKFIINWLKQNFIW